MKDLQPSTWVSFWSPPPRGFREEVMAKEGQEKKGLDKNPEGSSYQGNREEWRRQRHLKVGTVDHSGWSRYRRLDDLLLHP